MDDAKFSRDKISVQKSLDTAAHILAKVVTVVVSVVLPSSPLVGAKRVFACLVALPVCSRLVFIDLSASLFEAEELLRHVRNGVFVVSDSPRILHLRFSERRISIVTYARLTEVNKADIVAGFHKIHRGELCKGSTETVSSSLN
jgi:hypothetical protein